MDCLFTAVNGNLIAVELLAQLGHRLTGITSVGHHIQILVAQVRGIAPVRLDGDAGHAIGDVEVGALREHTATDAVKVLIRTLAVGEIEVDTILGIIPKRY